MANKIIKMTIRIPEEIDRKLREESKKEHVSKNTLIIQACMNFFKLNVKS